MWSLERAEQDEEFDMKAKITCLLIGIGLVACGGGGGGGGTTNQPLPMPLPNTVNLSFDFTDFTEVAVRNSFEIIVQEGSQYSVSITIDEQYADLVAVVQESGRLRIGFREDFSGDIRATVLEGIVTLPRLTAVEVINSAVVTMAGFSGSFLEVNLSGSAILEGPNNRIDFVGATLSGSSQLQFQDIAPVPSAHIELSGSSSATINMASGGTLTGTASGQSSLFYYGDALFVDVTTLNTASVARLGSTR